MEDLKTPSPDKPFDLRQPSLRHRLNPRLLFSLYRAHVRAHPLRELFAAFGVASGVALLFAVQVANRSVTGSFDQLARGAAGRASLEVAARSPEGFDQALFGRVERLRSVEAAAAVVERRIAVRGPRGRRALTLVGADERLGRLGDSLVAKAAQEGRNTSRAGLQQIEPDPVLAGEAPTPQSSRAAGRVSALNSEDHSQRAFNLAERLGLRASDWSQ